jgi:hypothetical protein
MPTFTVTDGKSYESDNNRVPNPNCCSNPRVLCPSCARILLAVNTEFVTTNAADEYYDPNDILPLPVMNFADERDDEPASLIENVEDDILPLPRLDFAPRCDCKERKHNRREQPANEDYLKLPTML